MGRPREPTPIAGIRCYLNRPVSVTRSESRFATTAWASRLQLGAQWLARYSYLPYAHGTFPDRPTREPPQTPTTLAIAVGVPWLSTRGFVPYRVGLCCSRRHPPGALLRTSVARSFVLV